MRIIEKNKKFIIETVKANSPISECENIVSFQDIDKIAIVRSYDQEAISIDELDYLFFYAKDCFRKPYKKMRTICLLGI